MLVAVHIIFPAFFYLYSKNSETAPKTEKKSFAELRRAFRLQALHAARLIVTKQNNCNEAMLGCSYPDDLYLIHTAKAPEADMGE